LALSRSLVRTVDGGRRAADRRRRKGRKGRVLCFFPCLEKERREGWAEALRWAFDPYRLHTSEQPTAQATPNQEKHATELKNNLFLKKSVIYSIRYGWIENNSALSTCDMNYEIIII
jgi:hypothetical protein